jgi:hypothetical protein
VHMQRLEYPLPVTINQQRFWRLLLWWSFIASSGMWETQ